MKFLNTSKHFLSIAIVMIASLFLSLNSTAQGMAPIDSDGNGRLEISTKQHLLYLSENITNANQGADYEQVNNIYFSDADFQYGGDFYNDGKGFRPIDGPFNNFYGSYDGQGFIIDGLYINRPSSIAVGFFSDASGNVKNLGLTNVEIIGEDNVGSISGYSGMTITNCYATGTVQGDDFVGGLVGEGKDRVSTNGQISNSYFDGAVSGNENIGGLVGDFRGVYQDEGLIDQCYAYGSVSGDKNVGGLVGYLKYSEIKFSYSTSSVSGSEYVGGFVGNNYGFDEYYVFNSFWNTQTSGQNSSDGGTGKTTSEMKNIRTYTDVGWSNGLSEAWDFTNDPYDDNSNNDHWNIDPSWNNGYPFFANGLKPEDSDGDGKLEIAQVEHLQYLAESPLADLSADYEQVNDINFTNAHFQSDGKFYNYGHLFNPIGDADNPFTGSYDGQGYSIDGLKISREDSDNIGFLGVASGVVIKNLAVTAIDFVGKDKTGGLVGRLKNNSTLENCEVTGYTDGVQGKNYVGGIIGLAESSSINECYTDIDVNGSGDNIGGIVGKIMSNSTLENCEVTSVYIDGVNYVGGMTGYSKNSSIKECNTDVNNLDGTGDNIGGLVGANDNSIVEKSHSSGQVTGQDYTTGGLVGWNKNSSQVINSYSLCRVSGNKKVGGLVAVNESSTVSFCYASAPSYYWPPSGNSNVGGLVGITYNGTTTNSFYLSPADSPVDSDGGTGKTDDELQDVTTYTDVDASEGLNSPWDFINDPNDDDAGENIWALIDGLNNSYPLLFSGEGTQPVDNDGDGLLEIANRQDLLFLSQNPLADWTADYEQIADISFGPEDFEPGGDFYNGGQGFRPIGSDSDHFRGDYDGQGFSITGLTINRPSSEQVGMFGSLALGTIKGINLVAVDIAGKKMVGALAGKAQYSTKINTVSVQGTITASEEQAGGLIGLCDKSDIKSCETDVIVSGLSKVGGLAGEINNTTTIEGSSVQGTITADEDLAGGLAGLVEESTITTSETNVDVSALSTAGGIAGKGYYGTIEETSAQGTISVDEDQAGGIAGYAYQGDILSCEADVEVSASTEAGGITGLTQNGIINSCEANVDVSASTKAGGITGYNNRGTIENTSTQGTISAEEEQAGGVAGLSYYGDIKGCEVDVNVNGGIKVGGIAGEFKNGTLINASAQGTITAEGELAGGLNGLTWASQIKSCVANVDVSGLSKVGGITGSIHQYNSKISKTTIQGTVSATNHMAGGLAGVSIDNADIENCEADVDVTAASQAGGLVGKNERFSSIVASSAKGDVFCSDSVAGGLVGYNAPYSSVKNCFATGNVEGDSKTGGLIGSNESEVLTSYSTGAVTGNANTGGLIGHDNGGTITNAFWDTETSGLASSAAGTGKTTAEMKDVATFTDIATEGLTTAWDFVNNPNNDSQNEDYWTLAPGENQGYPYFFSPGQEPADSDGDGISEIYTKQHLLFLSRNPLADWSLDYVQMNDIAFSSEDFQQGGNFYDGGTGFRPIGNSIDKFSGTYNGNDYEISGLYINRPDESHIGFFGYVEEATISHLHITDADIVGNSNTGVLIGEQDKSVVQRCSSSGEIVVNADNAEHVGGLIGKSQSLDMSHPGQVTRCHADVTITSSAKAVGGLIGYSRVSIDFSYALGNVSGKNEVGGLVGYNYSSTIQKCYARGEVFATLSHAGGLVGKNYSSDIENSYATGSVSGTDQHLGGLIGENTGNWYTGSGEISNCFWDTETSGQTSSDGGTGKTTAEMKDVATYTDLTTQGLDWPDTWDFVGDPNHDDENNSWWNIDPSENDGYPYFYSPGTPLEDSDNDGRLEIYTKADLLYLAVNAEADMSLDYEQMNDIEFEASDFEEGGDFYFDGKGFIPIGYTGLDGRFTGSYDGQGYIIDGLYINRPDENDNGFFKKILTGFVENLGVININIEGKYNTGAIAGQITNGSIVRQCFATGNISGYRKVGGIIGDAGDGSHISESYSHAEISGDNRVGGIVGEAYVYSSYNDTVAINNCYSLSNITANNELSPYAGGIVAYISKVKVENCFAAGLVSGDDDYIGGAIGQSGNATIMNVFWDTEISGQDASNGGTGKTTAGMKALATYTDTSTEGLDEAWDFVDNPNDDSGDENIWTMEFSGAANNGYPYLAWQTVPEVAPEVESLQATNIEATSAKAKGNILSTGNPLASQHGVIWNNTGNPTFDDNKTEEGAATENGEFSSELTGLMPNRTYYYKAYAINELDTVYGDEVSFITSKKELALAGSFTVEDKIYEGSVDAEIMDNNLVLQGIEGSDVVTLESVSAEFSSSNAGSAIVVNITNASLGGTHSENYTISLEGSPTATANITEKELTVTADDKEREQCAPNPSFTFAYAGFVDGEDETMLTTEPVLNCSADASSVPGEYDITLSGGEDENYAFNYVSGTLTIIEDTTNPVAVSQDLTIALGATGTASITAEQVDNGSTDNCGIDEMIVQPESFNCTHIGDNEVTLTVIDAAGNENSETAIITVEDNLAPTVITKDITVELNADGEASITTADIDDGSSDNCSFETFELDVTDFDCSDVGENVVTLTAVDPSGNTTSQTATVTVVDEITPEVLTQDITLELDANGQAAITTDDIDNGSTDNCSIDSYQLDVSNFDCSDIGENVVTLTVTDANGNIAEETALVTVQDNLAPTVITQDMTVELDVSGVASISIEDIDNGSYDNCAIDSRQLDATSFNCSDVGDNTVTLTVTDVNGNENSETAIITIEDNLAPTVITKDITVELNADGEASITTADIDDGSSDNCSFETFELDITDFDCSNVGENVVTLTAVDPSGNTTSQTATVTVVDEITPEVLTQDVTLELDANGQATITTGDIDNGSTDNCSIDSYQLDVSNFDCSNIGENVVTLTVTDANGNTAEETAVVTVQDNLAPTVITQDITAELDISGMVTISIEDIDNGSYDNCTIDSRQLDATSFNCSDVGDNTVTLTVTDVNGNENSETAIITIEDNIGPTVLTQDTLIELNPAGEANVTALEIDNGSYDNCAVDSHELDQTFFDETDIGENVVTLTVTDVHGNPSSETAIVTIADNTPPTMITQPVTLYLDMNGEAFLTAEQVDNGSYDNVEIASMEIDLDYFTCGDTGEHTVTLSATDISGNSSSATELVTVLDTITPSALQVNPEPPLCYGGADGQIEIIPEEGFGEMAFSIDNGATWQQDDGLFTDLTAGTYNIVVESANGCLVYHEENPVVFEDPAELVINDLEATDATCNNASNGMIDVESSGGTGSHYYTADGGANWQEGHLLYGLPAGSYEVMVMDDHGCVTPYSQNPVEIDEPEALVYEQVLTTDVTCNGSASGAIEISASGGTGTIEYSIGDDYWQTNGMFGELAAGEYDLRIRDDHNCLNIYDDNPVTLSEPEALVFDEVAVSDVNCFGGNDGSIELTAAGGTGAYQYSIDAGASWQSENTFTDLESGSYEVLIKDDNECVTVYENNPVTVGQPDELVINQVTSEDLSCFDADNGQIAIEAAGGLGEIQYAINNEWQAESTFGSLVPGEYEVQVQDENQCLTAYAQNPVTIEEPEAITVDISASSDTAMVDETITLTVESNYSDAECYWTPLGVYGDQVEVSEMVVGEYEYTVTATNENGCEATEAKVLVFTINTQISGVDQTIELIIMPNPSNGKFAVQVKGMPAEYTMQVFNGNGSVIAEKKDIPAHQIINQFDLTKNTSGTYFLRVLCGHNQWVRKIILDQ